jgi:exonuclease III
MVKRRKDISMCVWNVNGIVSRYQNKFENPDFLKEIKKHDIIGLVETHLDKTHDVNLENYSVYRKDRPRYKSARRNFGGIAIFIKDGIRKGVRHIESKNENYHWIRLMKDFFSFENDVYMCVCHIPPHNSTYTLRNGDTVLEEISSDVTKFSQIGHVVICGDLNARTGKKVDYITNDDNSHFPSVIPYDIDSKLLARESQDEHVSQRGNAVLDLCIEMKLRLLNGRSTGDTCGKFTCHNTLGSSVVDYVIVSEALVKDMLYFHVHNYNATFSDHCKLSYQLNTTFIEQDTGHDNDPIKLIPLTDNYKWNNHSQESFTKAFENTHVLTKIQHLISEIDKPDIPSDEHAKHIQNIYHTAAKISCLAQANRKLKKKRVHKQPWYDRDLSILKQRIRAGSKQMQANPYDPIVRGLFYRDLKYFNRQRKIKMRNYKQDILNKLQQLEQTNPGEFWKLLDKLKKNVSASHTSKSDKIGPKEWYEYFKTLNTVPDKLKDKEQFFNQQNRIYDSLPTFNELCYKIDYKEVQNACKSLRNQKAAGVDGLISEMIKASLDKMLPSLTKLFNKILTTSQYPACWLTGCITPIFKADDPLNPKNYRGITVNSCLGKLLNIVLNNRLDTFLTEHHLINEVQIGFKKKARTSDHMLALKTLITKYTRSGRKLYACFVDFKKAYDLVLHQCLFYKMQRLGIGGIYTNLSRICWLNLHFA